MPGARLLQNGSYRPTQAGGLRLLQGLAEALDTLEEAIHQRIDDTPALAALLGDRHWTSTTPWPDDAPAWALPYLVLDWVGSKDRRTTGRRYVVDQQFQATIVGADPRSARLVSEAFRRAFNQQMAPLAVADYRWMTCYVTAVRSMPASADAQNGGRVQVAIDFVVSLNGTI